MTVPLDTQENPMSRNRSSLRSALTGVAGLAVTVAVLSGCSVVDDLTSSNDPSPSASSSPTATETPYDSQFTRDGTFQSHIEIDGMDYVYTLYPTKSTPRTNEWFPKGKKFFSFTFQAYDLDRDIRDDFKTKRKVWLQHIKVTSETLSLKGGTTGEHPYTLDAVAKEVTFDPEPVSNRYGMLVTSPKGAFELRNQAIKPTSMDTKGIDLHFTATIWVESRAGSNSYTKKTIRQKVPISIFQSDKPTEKQSIPVDAN